ncbi:MAG: carboxypeptidase-like regulatory domain-containing protein, partial [Carboxylicivirga sp.]|nr:carboxypeptidase-like regulatory domain-containing protein [Carboxylicivirga sp.]
MKKVRLLHVMMMLVCCCLGTLSSYAQDKVVSGTVMDESNVPIPGVSIIKKGTTQGTITDIDGKYNLSNLEDGSVLVF